MVNARNNYMHPLVTNEIVKSYWQGAMQPRCSIISMTFLDFCFSLFFNVFECFYISLYFNIFECFYIGNIIETKGAMVSRFIVSVFYFLFLLYKT